MITRSLQRGGVLTANPLIINDKMFDGRSKGGCFLFIGEKQTFILDACAAGVAWVIVRVFCCNN